MPDDPAQQEAAARQQMAEAALQKDINDIVEIGRNEFGSDRFDETSQVIADKLGDKRRDFMAAVAQFDAPHRIIQHLADNPGRLENLTKLPLHRAIAEIAKIESEMSPHGHAETFAQPAWRRPETRSGRVSEADWKRNYGSGLSDKQWNKEFDRRMAERAKSRGYMK